MVDVDAVMLAQLEADGVVESTDKGDGVVPVGWAGETGADPGSPGPKTPPKPGPKQPRPQWAGETGVQA
jgi:hypothetical protein